MKNSINIFVITVAIVGVVGVAFATSAFAQNGTSTTSYVQKLSQKLGLAEEKVQTAVSEIHDERHTEMVSQHEQKLQTYVENGELTSAQKDLIIAKMNEFHASRDSRMQEMQNKTPDERRTAMEAERTALENWAKENNIDMKYMRPFGKGFGGRGGHMGGMGGRGMMKDNPNSNTLTR